MSTPASDQALKSSDQQQPSEAMELTTTPATTDTTPTQAIVTKPVTIAPTQVQQVPLALTTQLQVPQFNTTTSTSTTINNPTAPPPPIATLAATTNSSSTQIQQLQAKIQVASPLHTATSTITAQPAQPLALATAPSSGATALVIIPQPTQAKVGTISAKTIPTTAPTVGLTTSTHMTLAATTQSAPIQLQTPVTTHVSRITPVPIAAHQQSSTVVQPTIATRPQTILPVPITTPPTTVKTEQNKYTCCLLDNGVRCDRVAGNASFSARIQKIVATKKMDFILDSSVRHAYICEHHKAIITVARKSSTLNRDTKSARAYNNAGQNRNFNDSAVRQQQQQQQQQAGIQYPMNLEMIPNKNRASNNHTGPINATNAVQGPKQQLAYYQGSHQNQVGSVDVMMSGNFSNTGGDLGSSGSGGIDVDLQQLQVNTLRRYKRHFRVPTRPGLNKTQLAESLKSHFRTLPIIEKEAITYFVYIVKCYRNKLDQNPKAD